jgi:hypothetical protein
LQIVETQVAAVPMPVETTCRAAPSPAAARGSDAASEPLKLVETQPGAEQRSDNQP